MAEIEVKTKISAPENIRIILVEDRYLSTPNACLVFFTMFWGITCVFLGVIVGGDHIRACLQSPVGTTCL